MVDKGEIERFAYTLAGKKVGVVPLYSPLFCRRPNNNRSFDVMPIPFLGIYVTLGLFPSFWAVLCQGSFISRFLTTVFQ